METTTIKIHIEDLPITLKIYQEGSILHIVDICEIDLVTERDKNDIVVLKTNNKTLCNNKPLDSINGTQSEICECINPDYKPVAKVVELYCFNCKKWKN